MIDSVLSTNNEYIILGDFNINLLKPQGYWQDIIDSLNLKQFVHTATRVNDKSSTIIDHIYASLTAT